MIQPDHLNLSIAQQCRLASLGRSTFYHVPRGESAENLDLMARIDRQFLETPFYGTRQMTWHLQAEGHAVNVKRGSPPDAADRLDADLPAASDLHSSQGAQALSVSAAGRQDRPAQPGMVCRHHLHPAGEGLPVSGGDHGLVERKVLAWRLSNTMDVQFCVDALDEALSRHDKPEIFNTDQGSQFTSWAWTQRLKDAGVRISMDGRSRFLDNIFIERLWRSLKYECIYLHAFSGGREARQGIGDWMVFYNHRRPHAAHGGETPVNVYRARLSAYGPGLRPALLPTALAA